MSNYRTSQIESALSKKGFVQHNTHHKMFTYYFDFTFRVTARPPAQGALQERVRPVLWADGQVSNPYAILLENNDASSLQRFLNIGEVEREKRCLLFRTPL